MSGWTSGRVVVAWTLPTEVGRRLQTETVIAGKGCSGSPSRSVDKGWTWYSRSGVSRSGPDFVNMPNWLGAIDIGPLRVSAYCRAMRALPNRLPAMSFSVGRSAHLEDGADLEVVLQVLAHAGQVMRDGNSESGQTIGLSDPGQLQEFRAVDGPGGKDDLGPSAGAEGGVVGQPFHTGCAATIKRDPLHQRMGHDAAGCRAAWRAAGSPRAVFQRRPRDWFT